MGVEQSGHCDHNLGNDRELGAYQCHVAHALRAGLLRH